MDGLGAGEAEPQRSAHGMSACKLFREFQLRAMLSREQLPAFGSRATACKHLRMTVAEDQRPLAQRKIQVLVAIHVHDMAAVPGA